MTRRLRAMATSAALSVLTLAMVASPQPERHEITVPSSPGDSLLIEWEGVAPAGAKITGECPQDATTDLHTIVLTVPDGSYDRVDVAAKVTIAWQDDLADLGLPPLQDLILTVWHDGVTIIYRDVMENWREADSRIEVVLNNPPTGTYAIGVCAGESHVDTPFTGALVMAAGAVPGNGSGAGE